MLIRTVISLRQELRLHYRESPAKVLTVDRPNAEPFTSRREQFVTSIGQLSANHHHHFQQQSQQQANDLMMPVRRPISAPVPATVDQSRARNEIDADRCVDPGAVEFRRLTASNFLGVEVVD